MGMTDKHFVEVFEKGMVKGRIKERSSIEAMLKKVLTQAEPKHTAGLNLALLALALYTKEKSN